MTSEVIDIAGEPSLPAIQVIQATQATQATQAKVDEIISNLAEHELEDEAHNIELCLQDLIAVNDHVPMKVFGIISGTCRNEDIELIYQGSVIGVLCFTKGVQYSDEESFTDLRKSCFIIETNGKGRAAGLSEFQHDYVVVNKDFIADYNHKFKYTSEIWGGFSHQELAFSMRPTLTQITLLDNLKIPSDSHKKSLTSAIHSHSSISRFLKLYHQIELSFDWIFVQNIKKLNDDIVGFGKLVKNYSNKEIDSLKEIIYCHAYDFTKICALMVIPAQHKDVARCIFQDYSKDSNPIKDKWDEAIDFFENTDHTSQQLKDKKLISKNDIELYEKWISNLSAYWIYRTRCSIAHNKIGEYIITESHDLFIIDFVEPLIMEILRQIYNTENKPLP